jgi:hypothetical protein
MQKVPNLPTLKFTIYHNDMVPRLNVSLLPAGIHATASPAGLWTLKPGDETHGNILKHVL